MNINNFPPEILERVLYHLPIGDRKNASLVCRSWAQLAFSRPCMEVTELLLESCISAGELALLAKSGRKYRNVCLRFYSEVVDTERVDYLDRILRKLSSSIERVRFVWDVSEDPFKIEVLLKVLQAVPGLRELLVEDLTNEDYMQHLNKPVEVPTCDQLEQLTLPNSITDNVYFNLAKLAPSATFVSVSCRGKHIWNALRALDVQLHSLCIQTETKGNFKNLWTLEPSSLRKLHLYRHCNDLMDPTDFKLDDTLVFFSQCSALTTLGLELQVPIDGLQLLTGTCPSLQSILVYEIEEGWRVLQILTQFQHLNALTVKVGHFESKSQEEASEIFLPKLDHLTLDGVEFENPANFFVNLAIVAPNITTLQIAQFDGVSDEFYHLNVLRSVLQAKLLRLRKLVMFDNASPFPSHLLNQLNLLPSLKELGLAYYGLTAWNRSVIIAGVEKLSIDIYELTNYQLRRLLKVFPSLTRLDVVEPEEPINFGIGDLPGTTLLNDFNLRKRGFNIIDEWKLF